MEELIGREREQATLADAIAAAGSGEGGVILVGGEAGVGKTRLIRAVLTASGLRILAGSAGPGGTSSYGPIVSALRTYLRTVPDGLGEVGPLTAHLAHLLAEDLAGPGVGRGRPH